MDSKKEKWKLMYCATWKGKERRLDERRAEPEGDAHVHTHEGYGQRETCARTGAIGVHTSLLISSVSLSMRKIRALLLDGPWRSLCSSGTSLFFSFLCSAKEKGHSVVRVKILEKERKVILSLSFPLVCFRSSRNWELTQKQINKKQESHAPLSMTDMFPDLSEYTWCCRCYIILYICFSVHIYLR